jgi:hypothetical protein
VVLRLTGSPDRYEGRSVEAVAVTLSAVHRWVAPGVVDPAADAGAEAAAVAVCEVEVEVEESTAGRALLAVGLAAA